MISSLAEHRSLKSLAASDEYLLSSSCDPLPRAPFLAYGATEPAYKVRKFKWLEQARSKPVRHGRGGFGPVTPASPASHPNLKSHRSQARPWKALFDVLGKGD